MANLGSVLWTETLYHQTEIAAARQESIAMTGWERCQIGEARYRCEE